jgi:hypothetical protein
MADRDLTTTLTVKPEMPLSEFLQMFDMSSSESQYEKPLAEQHVGHVEFVRTDKGDGHVSVRIAYRHDEDLDIEIRLEASNG